MVCRVWRGWTTIGNAQGYDDYLCQELFPRLDRELRAGGYRGYQLLRLRRGEEVEFMTMLWFESIENVRAFAALDEGRGAAHATIGAHGRINAARYGEQSAFEKLLGSGMFHLVEISGSLHGRVSITIMKCH